jgi:hypothetical protein
MLNKDSIKIKYLIGTFRDEPEYPTTEDFEYLIKNWYYNEGGHHFIHTYRGIPESGGPIFPDNILTEKLNGDEKAAKSLLESLLSINKISISKSTKFTTYYEIHIK